MFPEKFRVASLIAILAVVFAFSFDTAAQAKRAALKKAVPVKTAAVTKKTALAVKDAKKDKRKDKEQASDSKSRRATDIKGKKDPKRAAADRVAEAERRQKAEERRQAAIAEQRRREQAAREARARKMAFESGLRTETVANISNDNTDGEDLAIRAAAVNALGSHAGSVVVMEAQTGKVLTIVNQNWAVRSSIRPCSTIKLVTAAAGLNEGVISKENGAVRNISTTRNLDDAIAFSDNAYFQRAGSNIGNIKLVEYGKKLGLGEPTGINLEGETAGRLPYSNNNARIYSHGDDTEVSTIQLAVMVSAITNGGNRVLPRIPRNSAEQVRFQTFYKGKVGLPQENVRRMIPGMMGTAEYGTARRNMNQSLGVAGKTGSCIDKGSWVGLFASVAPIEKPKYAVAVITRGQSERGRFAAAIAAQIYQSLATQIVRTDRNLAQTEFHLQPRNGASVTLAKVNDDDDADEANTSGENIAGAALPKTDVRNVIYIPSAPRTNVPNKLVEKTGSSKAISFPPVVITYSKDQKETTIVNEEPKKKRERIVQP